jgi:hypothetical protein
MDGTHSSAKDSAGGEDIIGQQIAFLRYSHERIDLFKNSVYHRTTIIMAILAFMIYAYTLIIPDFFKQNQPQNPSKNQLQNMLQNILQNQLQNLLQNQSQDTLQCQSQSLLRYLLQNQLQDQLQEQLQDKSLNNSLNKWYNVVLVLCFLISLLSASATIFYGIKSLFPVMDKSYLEDGFSIPGKMRFGSSKFVEGKGQREDYEALVKAANALKTSELIFEQTIYEIFTMSHQMNLRYDNVGRSCKWLYVTLVSFVFTVIFYGILKFIQT